MIAPASPLYRYSDAPASRSTSRPGFALPEHATALAARDAFKLLEPSRLTRTYSSNAAGTRMAATDALPAVTPASIVAPTHARAGKGASTPKRAVATAGRRVEAPAAAPRLTKDNRKQSPRADDPATAAAPWPRRRTRASAIMAALLATPRLQWYRQRTLST